MENHEKETEKEIGAFFRKKAQKGMIYEEKKSLSNSI